MGQAQFVITAVCPAGQTFDAWKAALVMLLAQNNISGTVHGEYAE